MKMVQNMKKFFLFFFVMGATSISLCGCFAGTERWREEVQLDDGRVITIEREILYERGGGEIVSNPSGTKPKEYRLYFTLPDQPEKVIEWRGKKLFDGSWPEFPLLLDIEADQPIVFTSVGIGPREAMYSKYVFQNDIWREEELPETFPERASNLFLKIGIDMPGYVDLETKRKAYRSYRRVSKKVGPKLRVITDY